MTRKTSTTVPQRPVVGGVDTHAETHHAAVLTVTGQRVADAAFATTSDGCAALLAWLRGHGQLRAVGVEGTGSYGAGLARHLHAAGIEVSEVNRPDRSARRRVGKSDPIDAYAAAEAVLAGRATATPKLHTGQVEAIRALHLARAGAVKARTAALNELHALLVTAPVALRDRLRGLRSQSLVDACARLRPAGEVVEATTRTALRSLARRCHQLTAEVTALNDQLDPLIDATAPDLVALHGIGYETAAQLLTTIGDNPDRLRSDAAFAALTGVAPVPASSGKTTRHRLSRGGDRQANRALYRIVLTRLATCPTTRAYRDRRRAEGLSTREIIRCLKRYAARQIYRTLRTTNPHPAPG